MRRNEGFTLVELLIVLAVIAALLATITPVALNAVKKAKATQVAQNLRNIKTAIEQYFYTEQPNLGTAATEIGSSTLFGSLTHYNYLSENPGSSGYSATVYGFENGVAYATVAYTLGDVSTKMVTDTYPDAAASGSLIYATFTIAKYW